MVIDVRGSTDEETYRNTVITMAAMGFPCIRVVCQFCGEDAYIFREDGIDAEGYGKYPCSSCGGRMKRDDG